MSPKLYRLIRLLCVLTLFTIIIFCGLHPHQGSLLVMALCVVVGYFIGSYK